MMDSCFDFSPRSLSVEEAHRLLSSYAPAPLETEHVTLTAALDRILAADIVSSLDVPAYVNSAMDGYALSWRAGVDQYQLVGEALAGHGFDGQLQPGEAIRITTGAPLPAGADTVVMREQAECRVNKVVLPALHNIVPGQNVRQAGEDIQRGQMALSRGARLKPQHLGLLASLGIIHVAVHRRPRVALFSSGDEVRPPGETLASAQIYDTNRFALYGMLVRLGADVVDLGILPDNRAAIHAALSEASLNTDMVITSGGVSIGQADWIKAVLAELGQIGFWQIALRPGKPLAFGTLEDRLFFGLPGNPVAAMVTFIQFVQPMLRHMAGEVMWQPQRFTATAMEAMHSRRGRIDYHRGIFHCDGQGQLQVRTTGRQGSNILTSMTSANCLIEIDADREHIEPGNAVTIQPFGELT